MFNRKKSLRSVPVRIFKTLEEANRHIDFLIYTQKDICINLHHTAKGWALGRVDA